MAPGTRVALGVIRDGKLRDFDVVLAPLDEELLAGPSAGGRSAPAAPGAAQASSNALGLVAQPLDARRRQALGIEPDEGVAIVAMGEEARRAGLSRGDVVLQVGRTPVGSPEALDRALAGVKKGDTVMLLVNRGGNSQFVAIPVL